MLGGRGEEVSSQTSPQRKDMGTVSRIPNRTLNLEVRGEEGSENLKGPTGHAGLPFYPQGLRSLGFKQREW